MPIQHEATERPIVRAITGTLSAIALVPASGCDIPSSAPIVEQR